MIPVVRTMSAKSPPPWRCGHGSGVGWGLANQHTDGKLALNLQTHSGETLKNDTQWREAQKVTTPTGSLHVYQF